MREILKAESGWDDFTETLGEGAAAPWVRLLPQSYWESERKAYLNLSLAQFQDWRDLGQPGYLNLEEVMPMNFAAQAVMPNWTRAQIQFCKILSQQEALQVVVALEIYERDHSVYPKTLEALVRPIFPNSPKTRCRPTCGITNRPSDTRSRPRVINSFLSRRCMTALI